MNLVFVPCDLYVEVEQLESMDRGNLGFGFVERPDDGKEYELVPKEAFQPVDRTKDVGDGLYKVAFIFA